LSSMLSLAVLLAWFAHAAPAANDLSHRWIGYTEYRTNLPGGRHANIITMRACIVRANGTDRRELAPELAREPYTWTQFAGWSPDGCLAVLGRGWESAENAAWEEEHQTFRMTEGWLYDIYLLDMASGALTNITAVERVSDYNAGLFFWPGQPDKLGFDALINGLSHPFVMDRDGRNKRDLSTGKDAFTYGFNASPDGARIAYHKDYQVYLADADGENARQVVTGNPFNFVPQWSPDGQWILFVSGEHYNCHPYVVRRDGTGLRKAGDRNGYSGVVPILDVPDFHGGSSDVPIWWPDGSGICFAANASESTELLKGALDGTTVQLTQSPPGSRNYHPAFSSDGRWLAFGANRDGLRQLYVMPAGGGEAHPITQVNAGYGAMWPHWQPGAADVARP